MSNPAPPKAAPGKAEQVEDDEKNPLESGPPEEEFWEKYSAHLEFPLSTVAAILLHVLVGAFIVFVLFRLASAAPDRSGVPLKLVEGGFDDEGEGSQGSGGADPLKEGETNPFKSALDQILPDPQKLPEAVANAKSLMEDIDPNGNLPVNKEVAAAFSTLDKELQKKLMGGRRGDGPGEGRGFDGTPGKGPGGTGADSTRARTMRWVLRFRTASGRDYIEQLRAMNGIILVPIPPENKKVMIYDDLGNLSKGHIATEAEERRVGGMIKFSDGRRDSVQAVSGALGLDFTPRVFWAVFPEEMEKELDRKERGYRNRRPEDIEETIFTVSVRGGRPDVVVYDQIPKR